jgi:hypothetical protein
MGMEDALSGTCAGVEESAIPIDSFSADDLIDEREKRSEASRIIHR